MIELVSVKIEFDAKYDQILNKLHCITCTVIISYAVYLMHQSYYDSLTSINHWSCALDAAGHF